MSSRAASGEVRTLGPQQSHRAGFQGQARAQGDDRDQAGSGWTESSSPPWRRFWRRSGSSWRTIRSPGDRRPDIRSTGTSGSDNMSTCPMQARPGGNPGAICYAPDAGPSALPGRRGLDAIPLSPDSGCSQRDGVRPRWSLREVNVERGLARDARSRRRFWSWFPRASPAKTWPSRS